MKTIDTSLLNNWDYFSQSIGLTEKQSKYVVKRFDMYINLITNTGFDQKEFISKWNNELIGYSYCRKNLIQALSKPYELDIMQYFNGLCFFNQEEMIKIESAFGLRMIRKFAKIDAIASKNYQVSQASDKLYIDNCTGYLYQNCKSTFHKAIKKIYAYWNHSTVIKYFASNVICAELIELISIDEFKGGKSLVLNPNNVKDIYTFNDCDELEFVGKSIFPENVAIFCNGYSCYIANYNDFAEVHGVGRVCEYYLDNESHGFLYVDCDYYESQSVYDEMYPEPNYVREYHSGSTHSIIFENKSPFRIGFEIEKEDEEILQSIDINDFEEVTNHVWRKERDGSLDSDSGFELISPVFELNSDMIENTIKESRTLINHINADSNYENCSAHMNLSDTTKNTTELYESIVNYMPLLYAMYPQRLDNNYCKAKTKYSLRSENEKYQAIKIHSTRLEFRIFPRIKNLTQLMFRIRLMELITTNQVNNYESAVNRIECVFQPFLIQSKIYNESSYKDLMRRTNDMAIKYKFIEPEDISDIEETQF
jgi:hypothetical protein